MPIPNIKDVSNVILVTGDAEVASSVLQMAADGNYGKGGQGNDRRLPHASDFAAGFG
jgi:hypothetical protein